MHKSPHLGVFMYPSCFYSFRQVFVRFMQHSHTGFLSKQK